MPPLAPGRPTLPRKRHHDEVDTNGGSAYSRNVHARHASRDRTSDSSARRDADRTITTSTTSDSEHYSEGVITRFPRQVVTSNVLLHFGAWVEALSSTRARRRLVVDDLREIVLNLMDGKPTVSPFLLESVFPTKPTPTKACVVLLGSLHPAVLQRFRAELPFFDACSSIPCTLLNGSQDRRRETPLPSLLYRYPKPPVNINDLSPEELFYGHELTFLMVHSAGYNDELILQPSGQFARKSQPQGGDWELDGDLLHLKWREQRSKADVGDDVIEDDGDEDTDYILDVLLAEDATMRYFCTDPTIDATYARDAPDHMMSHRQRAEGKDKRRSIRLSIVKAAAAEVPRDASGAVIRLKKNATSKATSCSPEGASTDEPFDPRTLTTTDFEPYVLTQQDLVLHLFPVDVDVEQAALMKETDGATRDSFVQTRLRSPSQGAIATIYALDCEMCETALGYELTRVTVVDVAGEIVYDQLVKPQNTIINYHTQFSGITEETLASTRHLLADVQRELLQKFLFDDTILVGHSLTSDLRALRLVHLRVVDTAVLYPHQRGFPFRASLKLLTKTYLGKNIQTKLVDGHDSAEDARAAIELLIQKVRRGPAFGIPEMAFSSSAYDTLTSKLAERAKRLTMLQYEHKLTGEWVHEAKKPWELYATGQLHTCEPSDHAATVCAAQTTGDEDAHATVSSVAHTGFDSGLLVESVEAATARSDDVVWLEINQVSDHTAVHEFIMHHEQWMQRQRSYCLEVDELLRRVKETALTQGTLLMVVPQGDLGLVRHLKGLQTRSRWKDRTPEKDMTLEIKSAVVDAIAGAMDSCVFLTQK